MNSINNTNDENMGTRERKRLIKSEIVKYINTHKKNKTYIKNKRQIYNDLQKSGKTYDVTEQTIYRYFNEMRLARIDEGRFDFPSISSSSLDRCVFFRKYNQMLCFVPNDITLGAYIADVINLYYANFSKDVHCIFVTDILICLYNDKKIDLDTLKEEIRQVLRDISIKITLHKETTEQDTDESKLNEQKLDEVGKP